MSELLDDLRAHHARRAIPAAGSLYGRAADRIEALTDKVTVTDTANRAMVTVLNDLTAELEAERALADQLAADLVAEMHGSEVGEFDYDSLRTHAARRSPKEPTP